MSFQLQDHFSLSCGGQNKESVIVSDGVSLSFSFM